jgi:uncharacterized membrane protein
VFFTRWVTHFCGPVFIFLAGVSAYLFAEKKGISQASRFLWTRALWLFFLELFVFRFGWDYHYLRPVVNLLIIWVIGECMLFLSAAVWLPWRWVLSGGLFILLTHNLLQGAEVSPESPGYNLWALAYGGGGLNLNLPWEVFVLWAFVPYVGVIFTGYGVGRLFSSDFPSEKRRKILLTAGSAAIACFLLLRAGNFYGDPAPWSVQKDGLFTFLSFINTSKYPSSLLYVLMTLGPALLLLAYTERAKGWLAGVLVNFGQVPFFYFILHLFLSQGLALLCAFIFSEKTDIQQFSLGGVYLAWLVVNAVLYPLCTAFGKYKRAHPEKGWLRYF